MSILTKNAEKQQYSPSFSFSVNTEVVGKHHADQLSHVGAWEVEHGTFEDLAKHIQKGHPWMSVSLDVGAKRLQENSNYAEILALDHDNEKKIDGEKVYDPQRTIEEAKQHPFIQEHCGLLQESANSQPGWNRFRTVYRLPRPVEGWETIRLCNEYLAHVVSAADPSCKDASRFFFGAPGKEPILINETATLPKAFIEDAIAWHEAIEAEDNKRIEQTRKRWEDYKNNNPDDNIELLIHNALSHIPPDCYYNRWIGIGIALKSLRDEWFDVWDEWSSQGYKYNPSEMISKWDSFPVKQAEPHVIFGIATTYGFRLPRQSAVPEWKGVEYLEGDRLQVTKQAIEEGYKYVLWNDAPGTGKNYDSGLIDPNDFLVRQIIHASPQHRNPTVETLSSNNGWHDLEARHDGLVKEETANGSTRLIVRKTNKAYDVPPNCDRAKLVSELREKYISTADSSETVCANCSHFRECGLSIGEGYGYHYQRKTALSRSKVRAHLDSLPASSEGYDYPNVVLVVDEPGETFIVSKKKKITISDLDSVTAYLAMSHNELFVQLKPLLEALKQTQIKKVKGLYGLDFNDLKDLLPIPKVSSQEVEEILKPDLEILKSLDDSHDFAERIEQTVRKHWLPDLIRILQTGHGGVSAKFENIFITIPDYHHREIAKAAKATIFCDAILTAEDLASRLGCKVDEIFACRQKQELIPELNNQRVVQVDDLKRLGKNRGDDQDRRAKEIIKHYKSLDLKTQVIDFKDLGGDGAWWRDSRGVNTFESTKTLILVGTPCRNINDLKGEYAVLTGKYPGKHDDDFQNWLDRIINSDIKQAVGRLRSHRRLDEDGLQVIILSDFNLDFPTEKVKSSEITRIAASKNDKFRLDVKEAVDQLRATNEKITQKKIASMTGYSQTHISRTKILQTL